MGAENADLDEPELGKDWWLELRMGVGKPAIDEGVQVCQTDGVLKWSVHCKMEEKIDVPDLGCGVMTDKSVLKWNVEWAEVLRGDENAEMTCPAKRFK